MAAVIKKLIEDCCLDPEKLPKIVKSQNNYYISLSPFEELSVRGTKHKLIIYFHSIIKTECIRGKLTSKFS